jgi:predicted CopG family antitoxin
MRGTTWSDTLNHERETAQEVQTTLSDLTDETALHKRQYEAALDVLRLTIDDYYSKNESLKKSLAPAEERASSEDIEALKTERERTSDSLRSIIDELSSEKRVLMNSLAVANCKASTEDVEALKDQYKTALSSLRSTVNELTSKGRSSEKSLAVEKERASKEDVEALKRFHKSMLHSTTDERSQAMGNLYREHHKAVEVLEKEHEITLSREKSGHARAIKALEAKRSVTVKELFRSSFDRHG